MRFALSCTAFFSNDGAAQSEAAEASICQLARGSHMIAAGQSSGRITLRDPRSLKIEKAVDGHSGGLTVLEAEGHMLLSLGYTIKCARRSLS